LQRLSALSRARKIALGAGALAAAAAVAVVALRPGSEPGQGSFATGEDWRGEVVYVSHAEGDKAGLEVCNPQGAACSSVEVGAQVPARSRLRTGATTRARI